MPTFLSVIGGNTFNLLHSPVQPDKPGNMSYENYDSPKTVIIAERFRFHKKEPERGWQSSRYTILQIWDYAMVTMLLW